MSRWTIVWSAVWTTGIILSLSLMSCSQKNRQGDKPKSWQSNMHRLSDNLSILLPLVHSESEFNHPQNHRTIERETKALASLAHNVDNIKAPADQDPALRFLSRQFSHDMAVAFSELRKGNRHFVRNQLKRSTSYCIACHTRTSSGNVQFELAFTPDLSSFGPLDKANFYAATRQFTKAMAQYKAALSRQDFALENPRAWVLATKKSLAISVRVLNDPNQALDLVQGLFRQQAVPLVYKIDAKEWLSSIKAWRISSANNQGQKSRRQKFNEAKKLIRSSHRALGFPSTGFINYLRASNLFHEILANPIRDPIYGESLYYAGLSAEALEETNFWGVHEVYYENCIRYQPNTELARKCYLRYERLQHYAYHNVSFPEHVRNKLNELKQIAGRWSF